MRGGIKVDLVSLASGAVIAALGALVLLDSSGAVEISLGWMAVALTGAIGVIVLLSGLASGASARHIESPRPPPTATRARLVLGAGAPLRPPYLSWPPTPDGPSSFLAYPSRGPPRSRSTPAGCAALPYRRPLRGLRRTAGGRRGPPLPLLESHLGWRWDAALTAVVVLVALGLILAPFLWRLGRSLAAERAERIRSQERAEVAAHLHDSVLQTLR